MQAMDSEYETPHEYLEVANSHGYENVNVTSPSRDLQYEQLHHSPQDYTSLTGLTAAPPDYEPGLVN